MDRELLKARKFTVVESTFEGQTQEVVRHPGAVVILPWVDEQRICLIQNRRLAVRETLVELPAGTLDPNEQPLETARRELKEETGYQAGIVEPLFEYFVSPGILNERMFAFVAKDLQPGPQQLMADEAIEPLVCKLEEAIDWIKSGKIRDAKTIATLLFYTRFHREAAAF